MGDISFDMFWPAFLLTLFAGLSTGIGAALPFFSRHDNAKLLSIGLGFSAGVMVYISFAEIMVKSKDAFTLYFSDAGSDTMMLICFFAGFAMTYVIDQLIPEDVNPHELKREGELDELKEDATRPKRHILLHRTGIFTAIAIGIHNFPEGIATFVAALDQLTLGIPIALAIAIHNIPESMAVSLPPRMCLKLQLKPYIKDHLKYKIELQIFQSKNRQEKYLFAQKDFKLCL